MSLRDLLWFVPMPSCILRYASLCASAELPCAQKKCHDCRLCAALDVFSRGRIYSVAWGIGGCQIFPMRTIYRCYSCKPFLTIFAFMRQVVTADGIKVVRGPPQDESGAPEASEAPAAPVLG